VHSPMYDRLKFPAKGYAGGEDGRCGDFLLSDGTHPHPKTKYVVPTDQEIILRLPGGGGFSPPCDRDPELVRQDVLNGYVSLQAARSAYGVWIEEGTYAIDRAKTAELRALRL
jgi:N-methylhydantoinase B